MELFEAHQILKSCKLYLAEKNSFYFDNRKLLILKFNHRTLTDNKLKNISQHMFEGLFSLEQL